jgi:hypothetical protein
MKHNHLYCPDTGKMGYTWKIAHTKMLQMKRNNHNDRGFHLEIYECRFCRKFHIGSQANHFNGNSKSDEPDIYGEI